MCPRSPHDVQPESDINPNFTSALSGSVHPAEAAPETPKEPFSQVENATGSLGVSGAGVELEQVPRPKGVRHGRRAKEFLEAGAKLIKERQHSGNVWPSFTVDEVFDHVDHDKRPTRGSFTHLWRYKKEYEGDLVTYVLRGIQEYSPEEGLFEHLIPFLVGKASFEEIIQLAATRNFEGHRDSPDLHWTTHFVGKINHEEHGSEIKEGLAKKYQDRDKEFESIYRILIESYGRRPKPGLTYTDIAVAMAAAIEGFSLHSMVRPEAVREGIEANGSQDWSLVSLTCKAIIFEFTEEDSSTETTGITPGEPS